MSATGRGCKRSLRFVLSVVSLAPHSTCLLTASKAQFASSSYNGGDRHGTIGLNRWSLPSASWPSVDGVGVNGDGDEADPDFEDTRLRFSGVGRLYAQEDGEVGRDDALSSASELEALTVVERLASATVAVVGLGGVGSWAAEALCRSGVGNLILVDLDDICISNTNRQVMAMSSTVGRMKIDEMRERLLDINPRCNVTNIHDFVTLDNVDSLLDHFLPELDVCLDAIDGHREKAALIAECAARGVPIVTCGGAAGRKDPSQIVCDDITRAEECRLIFRCRKNLRKFYGFKKGPGQGEKNNHRVKPWRIFAVFSRETQKIVPPEANGASSLRRCDGGLGTACFVTGTYGFVAASKVVEMIASDNLVKPRR